MSESYIFDFSVPKNFLRYLNIYYNIADMNGADGKFEFVLASYSEDNIKDCVDGNNKLNNKVTVYSAADAGLLYSEDDKGDSTIKTSKPVVFDIGEDIVPLKAVFVRDKTSKTVFLYCININPITVTNSFTIDENVVLYTNTDAEYKL